MPCRRLLRTGPHQTSEVESEDKDEAEGEEEEG